jgi:WD40 repeat protein
MTLELDSIPSDFYLSPLDWSQKNLIAFALTDNIVFINPKTMAVHEPSDVPYDAVSLRFNCSGESLFIGCDSGDASIFDVAASESISTLYLFDTSVLVADWKDQLIVCGSREGEISLIDVWAESDAVTFCGHLEEVCGIKIHGSLPIFATCANDTTVKIWDMRNIGSPDPLVAYTEHSAAVRAIAWSPVGDHILVTGGGTADKTIKMWDSSTGVTLKSIDTGSQVCNLHWNPEYNEILSTHGFSQNHLGIWKGSDLSNIGSIHHHTQRVLFQCTSPDGSMIATAAPQDAMQIWKLFPPQSQSVSQSLLVIR